MIDWDRILLWLFLMVVGTTAIYGVYVQYRNATQVIPEIYRTLVEPYTVAVRSGDYTTAYQRYTSAAFKQAHSFEEYLKAQNANLEDLGRLVEVTLKEDEPFQSAGNLFSGRRYHQGGLRWRGEKREAWVNWEVTQDDGAYRIDAMAEAFLNGLSPRIF